MKDHTPVSSGIAEQCKKIENQTKAVSGTAEDTEQLCVVITTTEFDEILRESRKSCPGPDKICYKLLRVTRKKESPSLPSNF